MPAQTLLRRRATSTLLRIAWLAAVVVVALSQEEEEAAEVSMVVTFVNEMPNTPIELFWENKLDGDRKTEGIIQPRGGFIDVKTFVGHEFSYDLDGSRHYLTPPRSAFAILAGDSPGIRVRCTLEWVHDKVGKGGPAVHSALQIPDLDILVKPYWAPRGASRFLELVREKYYDGVAFNRVVPKFLTQLGIAKDHDVRTKWDERPIADDFDRRPFEPGYVSFAGGGPDSRTTEIFIVMPGTSQEQLDYFGENEWEIPFATVEGRLEGGALTRIYDGYGDMPPWGNGPDPDKIYDVDGYTTYLPENYPKLDYIDRCFIVEEDGVRGSAAEL